MAWQRVASNEFARTNQLSEQGTEPDGHREMIHPPLDAQIGPALNVSPFVANVANEKTEGTKTKAFATLKTLSTTEGRFRGTLSSRHEGEKI